MAVQILAVRLDAAVAEGVRSIIEVVWRQDTTGKCAGLSRREFARWMDVNPNEIVYVRDSLGSVTRVTTFMYGEESFLGTVADGSRTDILLSLPRYVTATA